MPPEPLLSNAPAVTAVLNFGDFLWLDHASATASPQVGLWKKAPVSTPDPSRFSKGNTVTGIVGRV
jgi:hypothetical protein